MERSGSALVVILASVWACTGTTSQPVGVVPLFELPSDDGAPAEFYALPFPNDVRLRDDGTVNMSGHPRVNPLIELYLDAIDERQRGFGLNSAVFLRFDGQLDPTSLPRTPEESITDDASVYLVVVDPASPQQGERVPIRLRFDAHAGEAIGENWLSILPFPGFPLREETQYAAIVTKRVRDVAGEPLGVSSNFARVLAGEHSNTSAVEIYRGLRGWLTDAGIGLQDVVVATVFTTQSETKLMGDVREVIWNQVPVPIARSVITASETSSYVLYEGVYDAPNFQAGEPPYSVPADGGDIRFDRDGKPVVQRMEELRFALSVPAEASPPAGWPVVLYNHGTGGSYKSFVGAPADDLAAQGIAVISIDQVLHGPRSPGNPEVSFFNFNNPLSARDNAIQGALDNFQLLRLVLDFDFVDGSDRRVRFDTDRIYFYGHSQGGITGPPFLAYEPEVKAAILSGAGGALYLSLLHKTAPLDITALVAAVIRDDPLDEFNPILALVQMYLDRSDTNSYAPLLVQRPPPNIAPKHIFQSEGFDDTFTPNPNIEALATAIGGNQVGPAIEPVQGLQLRNHSILSPPVSANQNGVTAALLQYTAPSATDGHFVLFNVPAARRQAAEFLGTLTRTDLATVVAD